MRVLSTVGVETVATVFIAEIRENRIIEFVESIQPPVPREKKWVLMVSTLFGCPVKCLMCDAGEDYRGKLTAEEIVEQLDFLVHRRYPNGRVPAEKFKVQFARMGEPAYNPAVLDVLEWLPARYDAPGLIPSLSTIAPRGTESFFERLLDVQKRVYPEGRFQLQFSIHSTDRKLRDRLVPVRKWSFREIARYGERFVSEKGRKITLNFALAVGMPVNPNALLDHFDPTRFLIKITPLNPTHRAKASGLTSYMNPLLGPEGYEVVERLRSVGYQVIPSIGEPEESRIGSNCGQYVMQHLRARGHVPDGYTYRVEGKLDRSNLQLDRNRERRGIQ
jgi:23S rRNA (adenine2503-C2)-methyltransferase